MKVEQQNTGSSASVADAFIDRIADAVAARLNSTPLAVPRLMSVTEAAEYLGRSRSAVVHLIQRGVIPVTKIGGRMQVDRGALDKVIAENTYFET